MVEKEKKMQSKVHSSNRVHSLNIMLNDEEFHLLERYVDKYNVKNKSRLVREILIGTILHRFDEDHPTLF